MPIKSFEELNKYLGSIPYISNGGCAIAALFQYLWLKENDKGADVKIVYLYNPHNIWKFANNEATLKGKEISYESCSHAVILYNDNHIDCSNENFNIEKDGYSKALEIDCPEFVVKTLNRRDEWNSMFDRDILVPKMEERIGIKINLCDN